eukprot:655822-Prorocentrum_lima.AAC.1
MTSSLVGSEMCIRDSHLGVSMMLLSFHHPIAEGTGQPRMPANSHQTVSYTHLTLPTICSV